MVITPQLRGPRLPTEDQSLMMTSFAHFSLYPLVRFRQMPTATQPVLGSFQEDTLAGYSNFLGAGGDS